MEYIQTVFMIISGLIGMWLIGYPLTHFAFSKSNHRLSNDGIHALSFFSGYAIVVCLELLLIQLDIPVKYNAFPILFIFIGIFIYYFKKNHLHKTLPSRKFMIYSTLILLISSFSLVMIGSQFFKGYGWWDTLYYASHAEFLKNLPFSSLDAKVFELPYLGSSYHYFHGAHRIGRGVFQAFLASVYFVDGSSTLGFMNIMGILLVFMSVVYVLDGFKWSDSRKYFIAFAATIVPNIAITQLEGFIPIGIFTAFTVVLTRIFIDTLLQRHWVTSVLAGLLSVSFFTTLLDGTYVVLGMVFLSALVLFFVKEFKRLNTLDIGLILLTIILIVFPYREQFSIELGGTVTRSSLNFIYSFANSSLGLNWIFWGRTLTNAVIPNKLFLVMTFLSICFFIASFVGIFMIMYKDRRKEGFTILALALMPFIFMSMKDGSEQLDLRYSYFKVLTFSVPLIVIGLMNFFYIVLDWLQETYKHEVLKNYKLIYKVSHRFLSGLVVLLVVAFSISTIERVSLPLRSDWMKKNAITDRASNMLRFNDDKAQEFYTKLMNMEGENILFVSANDDLGFWWSNYYGRNNTIYGLTNSIFKTYIKDYPEVDLNSIPNDVNIMFTPDNVEKAIVPPEIQEELALSMRSTYDGKQHLYVRTDSTMYLDQLEILAYSKQERAMILTMDIDLLENDSVIIDIQSNSYVINDSGRYHFSLDFKQGGQEIPVSIRDARLIQISNITVGDSE